MSKGKKIILEIQRDGYCAEAITLLDYIDEVELWISKPGTSLKMKFGQVKQQSEDRGTLLSINEKINHNFKTAVFDYNDLINLAYSVGIIDKE